MDITNPPPPVPGQMMLEEAIEFAEEAIESATLARKANSAREEDEGARQLRRLVRKLTRRNYYTAPIPGYLEDGTMLKVTTRQLVIPDAATPGGGICVAVNHRDAERLQALVGGYFLEPLP